MYTHGVSWFELSPQVKLKVCWPGEPLLPDVSLGLGGVWTSVFCALAKSHASLSLCPLWCALGEEHSEMKAPRSISGRRHGRCTCTKTCHTKQADGRARRSRGNGGGHVAARFDPPNVPGLCFLPTAQLDCRWGSSSINPIPLKERGGKKKNQWL